LANYKLAVGRLFRNLGGVKADLNTLDLRPVAPKGDVLLEGGESIGRVIVQWISDAFTLVVTSSVIRVPLDRMKFLPVRFAVSIDGLPEHHDIPARPPPTSASSKICKVARSIGKPIKSPASSTAKRKKRPLEKQHGERPRAIPGKS
jgi:hypothetical protein